MTRAVCLRLLAVSLFVSLFAVAGAACGHHGYGSYDQGYSDYERSDGQGHYGYADRSGNVDRDAARAERLQRREDKRADKIHRREMRRAAKIRSAEMRRAAKLALKEQRRAEKLRRKWNKQQRRLAARDPYHVYVPPPPMAASEPSYRAELPQTATPPGARAVDIDVEYRAEVPDTAAAPAPTAAAPPATPDARVARDLVAHLNQVRAEQGLPSLRAHGALDSAAALSHEAPEQASLRDILNEAGAGEARVAAESALIVRRDDPAIAATVTRWMAQDTEDRQKLLDPDFEAVGVAIHEAGDDDLTITLIFAGR